MYFGTRSGAALFGSDKLKSGRGYWLINDSNLCLAPDAKYTIETAQEADFEVCLKLLA